MKFKSDIEIQAGVEAGGSTGSNGQVLSSTGSGVAWINQIDVVTSADFAESVHIPVKNTSGAQILKGTPVYVTGETGNSGKIEIAPADASDSAKMPALGLLESTLSNNGEGYCVQGGLLEGLATATIDGTSTTANDTVYVKSGGGLTMTKPTGTGLIQNIAKVARVHASNGSLVVSSILRTNDVPNLTTGKIWVGDGNTVESTVVHLDETNGRMGIGTTSPQGALSVKAAQYRQLDFIESNSLMTIRSTAPDASYNLRGFGVEANTISLKTGATSGTASTTALTLDDSQNATFAGSIYAASTIGNITAGSLGQQMEKGNASVTTLRFDANRWRLYAGASAGEVLTVEETGNIGIGTTGPNARLQVGVGTTNQQSQVASIGTSVDGLTSVLSLVNQEGNNSDGNGVSIDFHNAANWSATGRISVVQPTAATGTSTNSSMQFSTYGTVGSTTTFEPRMTIDYQGNVGIGTTSPSSKLSIGSNAITTKKPTVVIADGVAGGSLVIRGLSPILSFDRTGASPQNKILMDNAGLEFKTGTLDSEGNVDFKINPDGDLSLAKGAKISNQENTDIDSAAAEVVAQVAISYTAAFFDFVVKKGTNVRSGTVYACHDDTNVEFTETSTNDLGDTSDVTLSVDKTSTNLRLIATVTSDDWSVKSLIRAI